MENKKIVPLTTEEIRGGLSIMYQYQFVQGQLAAIQTAHDAYLLGLREQKGLGGDWVCNDLLTGFVQLQAEGEATNVKDD